MKNKISIFSIICLLILSGCDRNGATDNASEISTGGNAFFDLTSKDISITNSAGIYDKASAPTDFELVISALNANPVTNEVVYSQYNGISGECSNCGTRAIPLNPEKYSASVNNKNIFTIENVNQANNDLSFIYGNNVEFAINNNLTRSLSSTVSLYVPQLIRITAPAILNNNDMYPLCYYENFIVKWNRDARNQNGVLVVIEWLGTMAYGQDHPDMYYRVVDFAQTDSGQFTLSSDMFKDIPDTALCYLTVARGVVELIDNNNEDSYKIIAENHATIPFILIKNIN